MDKDVQKYLPHRPPFSFLDEFETTPDGMQINGRRTFRADEFYFQGHFPGLPVVPGMLLVEALAQCGGAGMVKAGRVPQGCDFFLASVKDVKFHCRVVPGDTLEMEVETVKTIQNKFLVQRGKGFAGGKLAVEAQWVCAVVPKDK